MAIPSFNDYLKATLDTVADGSAWDAPRLADSLADRFGLSAADRAELLPSGTRPRYRDRVLWALTYLFRAQLTSKVSRGVYRITEAGKELAKHPPAVLTQRFLADHYPPFADFLNGGSATGRTSGTDSTDGETASTDARTPSERLEDTIQELHRLLAADLLDRISRLDPKEFERVVLRLLEAMGYTGSQGSVLHTGQTGDEGIDGIVNQDHLGLERVYVQAKNWAQSVPGPELSRFIGAMDLQGASKGVFFTRSTFTQQARAFADNSMKRIILIDGPELAKLMIRFGVGVTVVQQHKVCRVDQDFFEPIE